MIKSARLCIAVYFAVTSHAFGDDSKDYTLTIDGVDIAVDLGDTIKTKSEGGEEIIISLKRNETSTFRGQGITFQHKSSLSVATSPIDSDIEQHLLASALGTVVIVQRYATLNPATLIPLMLDELTEDDVNAGAKLESAQTSRILRDGTNLSGIKATVIGRSETTIIEILVLGGDDEGFIAVTRADTENIEVDQPMLDQFWRTLSFKK
jgi:hypothetical protein